MRYHLLLCILPRFDLPERIPLSSATRAFHAMYTFYLWDPPHIPQVLDQERTPATLLQHPGLSDTSLLSLELDHSAVDPLSKESSGHQQL